MPLAFFGIKQPGDGYNYRAYSLFIPIKYKRLWTPLGFVDNAVLFWQIHFKRIWVRRHA